MKIRLFILFSALFFTSDIFAQPSAFYGVQTHFAHSLSRPDLDSVHVEMLLDSVKNAGINIIRDECLWSEIEKTKGVFTFRKYIDQYVRSAALRGIKILMTLDFNNPLYSKQVVNGVVSDSNRLAFTEYCKIIVARYSPMGVKYYEIWNEPNTPGFWNPAPDALEYTKLLQTVYPAIKKVDPTVTVIACATAPAETDPAPSIPWLSFISQVTSAGGLNFMDGVSFHLYRVDKSPENFLLNDIANIQSIVGSSKSLWISEIGYRTNYGWPYMSQTNQAINISKLYLLGRTINQLQLISYYDLKNDGTDTTANEHNFGLLNFDNKPKPAFAAYRTLLKETGNKPLLDKSIDGSWYKFIFGTSADPRTYALWFSGGQSSRSEMFNKNCLRVTDYLGDISYIYDKDKTVNIIYDNEPKFITETDSLPSVKYLEINDYADTLVAGQTIRVNITGFTYRLEKILIDNNSVSWSIPESFGSVDSTGKLTVINPGTATLTASFAGKNVAKQIVILPPYKYYILEPFNSISSFTASYSGMLPNTSIAIVDTNIASSRSLLLNYAYRFQSRGKHRVDFDCDYQMPGEPDSLLIDVYNDGNSNVLSAQISDKNGNVYSVNLSDYSLLNVKGWRSIRFPLNNISSQFSYPVRLKKLTLYTIKSGAIVDSIYTGQLLLDNLRIHGGATTGIMKPALSAPVDFKLFQNYPNPFNPETTISFRINERTWVKLIIYNVLGQEIATLLEKEIDAGTYKTVWNASGCTSGVYIYSLLTDKYSASKKMQLIR